VRYEDDPNPAYFSPRLIGEFDCYDDTANGFAALAELDSNHDRVIDAGDAIWPRILLWTDANHNGISEPSELSTLAASDVTALRFDNRWTGRRDPNGNVFQYQSRLSTAHGERTYYDVYLRVAR
jgi:hypothetical protein